MREGGLRPSGRTEGILAKRILAALLLAVSAMGLFSAPALASSPTDDVRTADAIVQRALAAARSGDLKAANTAYRSYATTWLDIEDGVRAQSRDAYRAIEKQMSAMDVALAAKPAGGAAVVAALSALDDELRRFVAGEPPAAAGSSAAVATPESTTKTKPTIAGLIDLAQATDTAVDGGDFAAAKQRFDAFSDMWIEVEGEVKTRSASDYRAVENDMARIDTAISQRSADAARLLDGMKVRLARYVDAGDYKPMDAVVIILREGLEALLVVVALLAFVKKSGNEDKKGWVWGGAAAGAGISLALGIVIKVLFDNAFDGANRELLEGVTGLVAAAMMLYVSHWLHSKSSLGAWKRYIGENTTRALARGSLIGLALLAFLAVFREGAETVLFLMGMAGRISTADLLLGLGIGAAVLAVIGVLLIVAGLKLPIRPFFAVASVLTFYLCFKFVGAGIHSLQVAGKVGAHTAGYLPESDVLGLFPTWETTLVQAALLVAALAVVLAGRMRAKRPPAAASDNDPATAATPATPTAEAPEPEGVRS